MPSFKYRHVYTHAMVVPSAIPDIESSAIPDTEPSAIPDIEPSAIPDIERSIPRA